MEESIGWRAIVVGRETPEKFELAMDNLSMGWSPEGEPDYPMDIVLGLNREARLTRLELTVLHWMARLSSPLPPQKESTNSFSQSSGH
jgi:hypothetical protein